MDYHLDECDRSSLTVTDSSAQLNHATAYPGLDDLYAKTCDDSGAIICNNAQFNATQQYYMDAPDKNKISINNTNKASFSAWFKTTATGIQTIISKANNVNTTREYRLWIDNGTLKFSLWDKNGVETINTVKTGVNDGVWHQVAVTVEIATSGFPSVTTSKIIGYYDNVANPVVTTAYAGYPTTTTGKLYIGAMNQGGTITDYFTGNLDEIHMIDDISSASDVDSVYAAEVNHKTLEQSGMSAVEVTRTCPCSCPNSPLTPKFKAAGALVQGTIGVTPTWPTYAINDLALLFVETRGNEPVTFVNSQGFSPVFTPQTRTGAATGTQLSVFWARAGITPMIAPSIADPGDHVIAQILTYSGVITTGNPWDDTNGSTKTPSSTSLSAPAVTTTVTDTLIVQAASRATYPSSSDSGFTVNTNTALTSLTPRVDVKTSSGDKGGFAVWDGGKATIGDTGTTTATVESSINAMITIALKPPPAVIPLTPTLSGRFDAWEQTIIDSPTAPAITDRKIYTKVSGEQTTLKISSMSSDGLTYQNTTSSLVGWRLVNSSTCPNGDDAITAWSDLNLSGTALFPNPATISFIPTKAYKDVRIQFATKNSGYTDRNCSTDNFSIRPAYFSANIPLNGFNAEEQKTLSLTSVDANGSNNTNALEYNTTVSTISNISISNQCESNTAAKIIDNLSVTFENGKSTVINAKFKDIGDFNATLVDSSWNDGDCIFGSGSNILNNGKYGCNVEGTIRVSVNPYELNTTLQSFSPSSSPPWVYLDSSRTQHVEVNAKIEAFGKDGTKSKNFSDGCAGSSVPLGFYFLGTPLINEVNATLSSHTGSQSIIYNDNPPDSNRSYNKLFNNQSFFSISPSSFKNGDSNLSLKFNFLRNWTSPINPFNFKLTDIKTSNPSVINNNASSLDKNATFVYGRARAYDIKTDQGSNVPNPIELEIYSLASTGYVKDMPQNVLHWYRNLNHDNNITGVISGDDYPTTTKTATSSTISINSLLNTPKYGLHNIYINNPDAISHAIIHLDIPSWLWYSTVNNYDFSSGSKCTQHPCFDYQFFGTNSTQDQLLVPLQGVNTGTFSGSDFEIKAPVNTTKKGIKVFR
jgi:hypothetical protein